ncbi:dihydroxy-acid dehydratase [Miniphocaeibacter halophilus]|uniref:dihydroxy-acid dehydratase domain-containing protein n=1 Tax=Miniphocaeibacter halophilus TaxID=2931922 RepID=UPI0021E156CC|nr:dihydroxy-acid dehydratase [Miniphocaeibacter halophilus]
MGYLEEELNKPLIAVVNTQSEALPGHVHLDTICNAVKEGILVAGGRPIEVSTLALCDGLGQGNYGMHYPLASRELIADSIECIVNGHQYDAMVLITGCDKITPGMLMACLCKVGYTCCYDKWWPYGDRMLRGRKSRIYRFD